VAYFAHTVDGGLDKGQYLAEHLVNVADGAEQRAAAAMPDRTGVAKAAKIAGLLHDIGKYRDGFIDYLKGLKVPEAERYHKQAGAAWAEQLELGPVVTSILGHHGGMPDNHEVDDSLDTLAGRQAADKIRDRAIADCPLLGEIKAGLPNEFDDFGTLGEELLTRLLFSCLVDADWEDTGRHEQKAKGFRPDPMPPTLDAEVWLSKVVLHIAEKAAGSTQELLAKAREDVRKSCLQVAEHPPGLFSLTVPTGGGKTLSGLAFALAHAKANRLRRIIYVVPYLSILDQNAMVIRKALGTTDDDLAIFEHHSLADPGQPSGPGTPRINDDTEETRIEAVARRAENWDAPVVITTNVMFFESLFSNQPRRCRKLHNIARSVIFLDECQNIPPELLAPTSAMLKQLVEVLGCSVVLATATQPALDHPDLKESALTNVHEIIPKGLDLFARLKRVRIEWPKIGEKTSWQSIASRMCAVTASLCIVNSRLGARELFAEIKEKQPEGAFHLSTSMCPAHRKSVLDEVRRRLDAGLRCRLVSTQLIEAGVDVDFPLVFREMAPFDSIIQAAGRCNREAKLIGAGGLVVVFRSAAAAEKPRRYFPNDNWYKGGRDVVEAAFLRNGREPEVDDPEAIREYFQRVYRVGNLDKHKIGSLRNDLQFRKVASLYRLIDDAGIPVVVPTWIEHESEIESMIESFRATRSGFRALAPFQVNLRCDAANPPTGVCEEKTGLFVWRGVYDPDTGWSGEDDHTRWVV
jgi:CRISPR-associated endonuclease/helicase Cas3